ncbi:MAG: ester cyclase [Gammaproteobacteria bacterium]|nr:ester cyclase [Gammaproteobacteria bacterium]
MSPLKTRIPTSLKWFTASLILLLGGCSATTHTPEHERGTPNLPTWWLEWKSQTETSRQTIQRMTYHANLPDPDEAFPLFVDTFSDEVEIYGLSNEVEGKAIIEEHYYPVFYFLKLALVNDVLIASGNQVMERYHAWRSFPPDSEALEFDGCQFKPESGAFSIRGYTLFEIDQEQIVRRFSNHDHGYRMQQTCGDGTAGDEIKAQLSGGFPDDNQVYQWGEAYVTGLSQINANPSERPVIASTMFTEDAVIHGVSAGVGTVEDFQGYLAQLWEAFPDLIYHTNGAATSWGRVAIQYQAAGSHRAPWFGVEPNHQPVLLRGEVVLRFNQEGQIVEAWIYDHLDELMAPYF